MNSWLTGDSCAWVLVKPHLQGQEGHPSPVPPTLMGP